MVLSKKIIAGMTIAALMSSTAFAQESTSDGNSSTVTYKEDYFVPFQPVTLHDMLRSVPGTAALLARADEELTGRRVRGFGSAGDQILIDGKRIAGKTNSLGLQLKRIQATSVSAIELIRGTKAGLDVQSEGLIINVILKETASTSVTTWTVGGEYVDGGKVNPLAKVNHRGEIDNLAYTFGVDFALEETRRNFNDKFFNAAGVQYQENTLTSVQDREKIFLNGGVEYNGSAGDILRLNGQVEFDDQDTLELDTQSDLITTTITHLAGNPNDDEDFIAGNVTTIERDVAHRPFHWEFGGDYERRFDSIGLWKSLFVINHGKHDFTRLFSSGLNGASPVLFVDNFATRTHGEKIIRSSLTNTFATVHTIEAGGEVAINDVGTSNRVANGAGVINPNSLSDIDVQEVRFEAFASHNWSIASNISLQSSVDAEWSEITQTDNLNDVPDFSRNFFYLKPRWNLRYDVDSQNQIRATIERKISQLDFGAFGSNFDVEDGQTDGGNALLRPEDRWEFSVAFENRFAEDQGSLSVEGFYNVIRDHIAKIPGKDINGDFTDDPTLAVTSIPGNIGNAKEYGVEINGNWRLKALNLPNAIITGKYILRETDVTDPFLMVSRPIEYVQKHEWLINFQHDLTESGTSYGFSITNKGPVGMTGGTIGFRTDVIEQWERTIEPKASAYIEQIVFGDMKLRLDLQNILKAKIGHDKLLYASNISNGVIDINEIRAASEQRSVKLTLQGSF